MKIKRFLAWLLTFAMLMTFMPTLALTVGAVTTEYKSYSVTSAALTNVQSVFGGVADVTENDGVITIKLTSDIKGRMYFNDNAGKFVLDLNGKTVDAGTFDQAICADHRFTGSLTITGSGTIKKGTVDLIFVSTRHPGSVKNCTSGRL